MKYLFVDDSSVYKSNEITKEDILEFEEGTILNIIDIEAKKELDVDSDFDNLIWNEVETYVHKDPEGEDEEEEEEEEEEEDPDIDEA